MSVLTWTETLQAATKAAVTGVGNRQEPITVRFAVYVASILTTIVHG